MGKKKHCSIRRKDKLKRVASKFTKYLIRRRKVSSAPIARNRVRELYLKYQEKKNSRIHVSEIVIGLYLIDVVKSGPDSNLGNSTLLFRPSLFPDVNDCRIDDEELIPVLTNQAQTSRNRIPSEPDICGVYCRFCHETFTSQGKWEEHRETIKHKYKSLYRNDWHKLKKSLSFSQIKRHNASIDINEKKRFVVRVNLENVSQDTHVEVKEVFILWDIDSVVPAFHVPVKLKRNETFEFSLDVCFLKYESHSYPVIVSGKSINTEEIFYVLVECEFKVIEKTLHDLGASEPFQYPERRAIVIMKLPVVPGRPLSNMMSVPPYSVALGMFKIPENLNRLLNCDFQIYAYSETDAAAMKEIQMELLRHGLIPDDAQQPTWGMTRNIEALNSKNYNQRMHYLLWMEEHQQNWDLHLYDQKDAILFVEQRGSDTFHKLEVPGLSENRPSILRGDELYVWKTNARYKYQGIVHLVEENFAFLALDSEFNYIEGEKVSVEFSLNRSTFKLCHRAVDIISKERLYSIVFPKKFCQNPKNLKCAFRNSKVEANKEQHRAVRNIVNNTAFPAPYIIYGPPGTGKTSTIVEAISQIHLNVKGVKICACAPSNAAADLLAVRLLEFVPGSSVYRIYSTLRSVRDIPEKLRKNCNLNERGTEFALPEMRVIASKGIIVVTPCTAGRIQSIGGNFYDYVFFDEAGHAEEPLTLIPVAGLLKRTLEGALDGNLILAGDPEQLGPIVHSQLAVYLEISLLERLMIQNSIYQRDPTYNEYDDRVITKLVANYRSHEILLHLPNTLFYENELKACADSYKTTAMCTWETLPRKNFPIIFHGVRGSDEREKNSPSYFNLLELQTVKQYIQDLTTSKVSGTIVEKSDIVVLTPYRKQVQKFREYFKRARLDSVEVKSVEEFQGQERKVVIISTVRSQQKFVSSDYQFGLGFLRNPKRFNVATTRAQALMIVVGNPDILQTDPAWRALIEFCIQNGGYMGEKPKHFMNEAFNPDDNLTLNLSSLTTETEEVPFIRHD